MRTKRVLLGLLAGFTVGAAIGIFFAPGKGSSTRKKIAQKGTDYSGAAGEKFDELVDGATSQLEAVKEGAARMVGKGKDKSKKMKAKTTGASS